MTSPQPILVDLTGSGENDVVVGSAGGLYPLDGATGSFLFGTSESSAINTCSIQNSPLVFDVPWHGSGRGMALVPRVWRTRGADRDRSAVRLPVTATPAVPPSWAMWRSDPAHTGVAGSPFG